MASVKGFTSSHEPTLVAGEGIDLAVTESTDPPGVEVSVAVSQAANVADAASTEGAALQSTLNGLLDALKAAGLMVADEE